MLRSVGRRELSPTAEQPGIPLKTPVRKTDRGNEARNEDLRQACQAFEGMLLGEMLKAMRSSGTMGEGILPVGAGERVFTAQQSEALGAVLARREPLGITRVLLDSLTRRAWSWER